MQQFDYNKYLQNNPLLKEGGMEEAKPFPKSKWGKPSADTWFSDVQYFIDTHKSEKLKPTDLIGIGDEEMTYADALKKYVKKLEENNQINEDTDSNEPINVLAIIKQKHGSEAAAAFKNTFIDGLGFDNQDLEALKKVYIEVKNILKSGSVKGTQKKDLKLNWDYLDEYIYDQEN